MQCATGLTCFTWITSFTGCTSFASLLKLFSCTSFTISTSFKGLWVSFVSVYFRAFPRPQTSLFLSLCHLPYHHLYAQFTLYLLRHFLLPLSPLVPLPLPPPPLFCPAGKHPFILCPVKHPLCLRNCASTEAPIHPLSAPSSFWTQWNNHFVGGTIRFTFKLVRAALLTK